MALYEKCLELNNIQAQERHSPRNPALKTCNCNTNFPSSVSFDADIEKTRICTAVQYISDIHLENKIIDTYKTPVTDQEVEKFIKKIVDRLVKKCPKECRIILFGGDISSCFEISKIFYTEFVKQLFEERESIIYIYAVLGNHELWDYPSLANCLNSFSELFKSLRIIFLQNSAAWFGPHHEPKKYIKDSKTNTYVVVPLKKEEDEVEYNRYKALSFNTIIIGGIGFSGYNQEFNALNGIYRNTVSREQEIIETKKWEAFYEKMVIIAKENKSLLIVLSHMPINCWKKDNTLDNNCIYFNGHTHKNNFFHNEESNIHVFADNQIGYHKKTFFFKTAYIYARTNPFQFYNDGYYIINSLDYLRFCSYKLDSISGTAQIDYFIKQYNAIFYMIKKSDYYGFFLISPTATYICAGGRVKRIKSTPNIEDLYATFLSMVEYFIHALSPYYTAQKELSSAVKSFGGEGKIHGCIIDIDFFNHIMLNPFDGKLTYYYSPMFGVVQKYPTLAELLEKHNKRLATHYTAFLKKSSSHTLTPTNTSDLSTNYLDIQNSIYTVSCQIRQLQRLFDKKVLRTWSDTLLDKATTVNNLPVFKK